MAGGTGPVVWWLRNDLRLSDNPVARLAVGEAFVEGRPCLPVFVLDPRFFDASPYGRVTDPKFEKSIPTRRPISFASRKCCGLRARFILQCLRAVAADLKARGSELQVCHGLPEEVLGALPAGSLVVCQQEPVSPECTDIEDAVDAALRRAGGELRREWGAMSLYHREDLPFHLAAEKIPKSYTELAVALGWDDIWTGGERGDWEGYIAPVRPHVATPAKFPAAPVGAKLPGLVAGEVLADDSAALRLLGYSDEEVAEALGQELPAGGEAQARAEFQAWLQRQSAGQDGDSQPTKAIFWDLPVGGGPGEGHDSLQWSNLAKPDGWMRMSQFLAVGCISAREIFNRCMADCVNFNGVAHRLLWREFHRLSAIRWGRRMFWLQGPGYVERPWTSDAAIAEAWKLGRTGVPYIDACMRELKQTGWLAYKGRKTAGFFLVFGLGVDWRIGAYHFEEVLLDYDCAMNYGNWVTVAAVEKPRRGNSWDHDATVADLAAAYREDIELKLSAEMANDPSGEYIRRWVPELRDLDASVVHRPWAMSAEEMEKCGCVIGESYPASLMGPLTLKDDAGTLPADEAERKADEATDQTIDEATQEKEAVDDSERRVHPHDTRGCVCTRSEFLEFAISIGKDESHGERLWSEAVSVSGFQEALRALEAKLKAKDELALLRAAASSP